jgi:hypothetical protein
MSDPIRSISQNNFILADQKEVSHDNTLTGNGTPESPLGVNGEYIQMLRVNKAHTSTVDSYQVTATVPAGYKFLCWVNMSTNGFSEIFYPLQPTQATCTWWKGGHLTSPTSTSSTTSNYLVIKDNS